jgi:hypothetical protein
MGMNIFTVDDEFMRELTVLCDEKIVSLSLIRKRRHKVINMHRIFYFIKDL